VLSRPSQAAQTRWAVATGSAVGHLMVMSDTPNPPEDDIDAALDDSFPASDPPSTSTPETSVGIDDAALQKPVAGK